MSRYPSLAHLEAGQEHSSVGDFVELSAVLTGFSATELRGTGMAECYYNEVVDVVGGRIFGRLLIAWHEVIGLAATLKKREDEVDRRIMSDSLMGPVARNIITMWYTGNWNQLPQEWRQRFGAAARDQTHVISAEAYQEGLVWPAIGAHPPAAKQPGFASWVHPPEGAQEIDDEWQDLA